MSKNCFYFLIIISVLIVLSPKGVSADIGPKPKTDINVVFNQQNIPDSDFSAVILQCRVVLDYYGQEKSIPENEEEIDGQLTSLLSFSRSNLIPQLQIGEYDSIKNCYWVPAILTRGGECSNSSCHFYYSIPSKFKLAVFIPSLDKVFVTNEISRTNLNSLYRVELFPDGSAKILETTLVSSFARASIITIILELLISLIFVSVRKLPKKILAYVLLANIISLPIVWFVFPLANIMSIPIIWLGLWPWVVIVISEIFAVLFETYFVYIPNKLIMSFKQSLKLSMLNNMVSLFVGGFIYRFLEFLFF